MAGNLKVLLLLLLLESCASVAQEHARGFSEPGALGNPGKANQSENKQPEINEKNLANIIITKVIDFPNLDTALINAGRAQGLNLGETFTVARKFNGEFAVIGEVKLIEVFQESAVVQLLLPNGVKQEENQSLNIGDRFLKKQKSLRSFK